MAVHCPECGHANGPGANFCQRCGAFLAAPQASGEIAEETAAYRVDDTGELVAVDLKEVSARGAALVMRTGGGREGESFALEGDQVGVGRRPESTVFLDDVTVSRDHALLVRRADGWHLDDLGSLNGTYVNRRRIDSCLLQDADEVQVGKYKLTFLAR